LSYRAAARIGARRALSELDDAELLTLSRTRPEAFGEVYRRHAEGLLTFFARRTLDPEMAAELTAETFAQAFASRLRFRDRGQGGTGWLYAIGRHQLTRFYRRGAVDARARARLGIPRREVSVEDYERIEELIDVERIRGGVAEAFGKLSADQREAMTLRVIEGRSYAEIATTLSCTEQTVRARVSRGLRKLGQLLEPEDASSKEVATT
jgi:RNA polymerase sigma-70 factor (ECF subfamily)